MDTQEMIDAINAEFNTNLQPIGQRYGYFADETRTWYWVSVPEIKTGFGFAESDEESTNHRYSEWCACCANREISMRTLRKYRLI